MNERQLYRLCGTIANTALAVLIIGGVLWLGRLMGAW